MLTISKPLSAAQVQSYHKTEFQNARENYYSEGDQIRGTWHGKLATEWGLRGEVSEVHFNRLTEGQHPITGKQLIRHYEGRQHTNDKGEKVGVMDHRAGWDATFSAPKSVSLAALVGGDDRIREAHQEAVTVALDEMERWVQARIGGSHAAETTGKWIAARFEHDSSRPVDDYAAPQLHTHTVFFNLTETQSGLKRALQPQELYRSQQYGTAVYRSELALRLRQLGYEIERGKSGEPAIRGFTQEYLDASSPRRQQIVRHLAEQGLSGAAAAQIAAHRTRQEKLELTREQMLELHRRLALEFGNQAEHVVGEARERSRELYQEQRAEAASPEQRERLVHSAIVYAREKNIEREAVAGERELVRDALSRSMGEVSLSEIKRELERSVARGELIERQSSAHDNEREFTTAEMLAYERDNIRLMREGQSTQSEMVSFSTRREVEASQQHLSDSQRAAIEQILSSRDQIMGLEGVAGGGKTTSLTAIREAAEREGYQVEGLAPTSRAAQKIEEAGIRSHTLQWHLARGEQHDDGTKRLYVVDESSLASSRQMNEFLNRRGENDRVLLVGDVRQHQAVEAGKPYEQMQAAGMQTAHLDEIVRQKDPELKRAVEHLSRGETRAAVAKLDTQQRIHEIPNRSERLGEIAREYARQPEKTLVISPDNASRAEINQLIHRELQQKGDVGREEHQIKVLSARQEMTGADRGWAAQYEKGDVVRYSKGSKQMGLEAGEYARVTAVDRNENRITVERLGNQVRETGPSRAEQGRAVSWEHAAGNVSQSRCDRGSREQHSDARSRVQKRNEISYDPRRLQGVSVYREASQAFSQGDRVQFTAPSKELGVANRELGRIEKIEPSGDMQLKMDSGRRVEFNIRQHPHLDHGYAVTSHSSQGQTAERVLVDVDTERSRELVNERMAYVAVSRARQDAHIYTNDKVAVAEALSRQTSHRTALENTQAIEVTQRASAAASERQPERAHDFGQSVGYDRGRDSGQTISR